MSSEVPPSGPPSRGLRTATAGVLAAVLLVGGAYLAFEAFVRTPPATAAEVPVAAVPTPVDAGALAAPQPPPEAPREATIIGVRGDVQRRSEDGGWAAVQVGDRLRTRERLRAGPGSGAELQIDDRSRVEVTERTEVGVEEVTAAVHRLKLVKGRIRADYREDGERVLHIEGEGGRRATVRGGAKVSVLETGESLSVATERGTVDLEAAGEAVAVGAGQQAVAVGSATPSAPLPVREDVLLLAASAARKDGGCRLVRGTAQPGSEVTVEQVTARVDAKGRFVAKLPPGRRARVEVVMRDAAGRTQTRTVSCGGRADEVNEIDIKKWHKRK